MYRGLGAYYLKNGQPTSVLYVGDTMGFNVPGYSKIWLDQQQNGAAQYSGPFSLPMAPYTLQTRDEGSFSTSVYELTPGNTKGKLIGTDSIQVLPAVQPSGVAQQTYAPPIVQQIAAPGYTNPTATPGGAAILTTGVSTPSAPAPMYSIYNQPAGPAMISPEAETPGTGDIAPGDNTSLLLFAGLGLLFLFMGGRRR